MFTIISENGACHIHIEQESNITDFKVKLSKKSTYVLKYNGYPKPTRAEWKGLNNQILSNSTDFTLSFKQESFKVSSVIIFNDPRLELAGMYEFIVFNNRCNKSLMFNLTVKGKFVSLILNLF